MKDGGIGHQKLLVARGNKGCKKIYGKVQFVPEDEEQDGGDGRKVEVK